MILRFLHILTILLFAQFISAQNELSKLPLDYYKAVNMVNQQKYSEALVILNLCKDDPNCILLKADILYKTENFAQAINELKNISDSKTSEAAFLLAVIYAEMGFADESTLWLEKHFQNKNPLPYSTIIGNKAFDNINKTSEWKELWQTVQYPKNLEKLHEADYLVATRKFYDAIEILDNNNFGSRNYIKHKILAEAYFELNNYSEADKNIETSLSQNQKHVETLILKQKFDIANGKYSNALQANQLLLRYDPYNPNNLLINAEICLSLNQVDQALTSIEVFAECFPQDENALFVKAKILYAQTDYRNSLINLNILIDGNSSKKEYFILRADNYHTLESWKFAADDYSMALDIDPFLPEVYHKLGYCYFKLSYSDKACHAWKKAASMKNREAAKMYYKHCNLITE